MAGFGIGGGMLDEQDNISQNRQEFSARMAELIARNPDLDVQGLMQLVNSVAGTDNTLRGIYTQQNLTPYVQGRDRAKRVQVYNTLQQWLKENPGASMADAQNAYYQYTGGVGGDPKLLSGFLDQAKQRKAIVDQQEKERQLSATLQNRGAIEASANDLISQFGLEQGRKKFIEQYGGDTVFGISADSLFNESRANDIAQRKAIGILKEIESMAGPDGDIRAYANLYAKDLTGPTKSAFDALVEQRSQQKLQGYNTKVADAGAMGDRAKMAAIGGQDAEIAFAGYVFQQIGMSPDQAAAQGIDLKTAKQNFDQTYKFWQDEKAKQEEAAYKDGVMKLRDQWMKDDLAVSLARNGKLAELEAKITQTASDYGIKNFTPLDAKAIVRDITERVNVRAEEGFKGLEGQIIGDVTKYRDDLVKESQARADEWWMEASKGVADAKGLTDPSFGPLLKGLGAEYNFADNVIAAQADKVLAQWAQEGGGDPMKLIKMVRETFSQPGFENASIASLVDRRNKQAEVQYGRFNQSKPVSAQDFVANSTSEIQTFASQIKADIDAAKAKDFTNPKQLDEAIGLLTDALQGAKGMPADFRQEYEQRQKSNNWLLVGEVVTPEAYASLNKKLDEAYVPLAKEAEELLASLNAVKARYAEKQTSIKTQTGDGKFDLSLLPGDIQSGYQPKPEIPTDAPNAVMRGLKSVWNTLNSQYDKPLPGTNEAVAPFYRGGNSVTGAVINQSPQQFDLNRQILSLIENPQIKAYISRNPAALQLLKTDPAKFVEVFGNAIKTNAAPAGTTQTAQ